jgi:glucuronate isomerase
MLILEGRILMKSFMDENFLLSNPTAVKLFHSYAKDLPIIDYHCHIQQSEIRQNKHFTNLTQLWLVADHYKWRAMRSCGVAEHFITGNATDYDKFLAWAKIMPQLIGNPLYHWTHLELQRYFNIHDILNETNAGKIWLTANKLLAGGCLSVNAIIARSKVEVICTTDDPLDDLADHIALKEAGNKLQVLPSFRPDKALALNAHGYLAWINKLRVVTNLEIENYEQFLAALLVRIDFFDAVGCKVADHGMNYVPFAETNRDEVSAIFKQVLSGHSSSELDETKFRCHTLIWLAKEYAARAWAMQLHMNVTRNNNSQMLAKLGPDTGFDAVNDAPMAMPLSRLLDAMNHAGLPKTILYSLNHTDNYVLGTLLGCFQTHEARGKIQLGSGWWFNDQRDGMEEQLKALANLGALGTFIGMLTDSRSFLSYTRHEYFRRILCNLIGSWVENGEYPADEVELKKLIQNISYYNAKNYFAF